MWCVGVLTEEYRSHMHRQLRLSAKPLCCDEPVIGKDEKSQQLIGHSRAALPMKPSSPTKQDYEYARKGTVNLFVAVEPKVGQRVVCVTECRFSVGGNSRASQVVISAMCGHTTVNTYRLLLKNRLTSQFLKKVYFLE